jgi:hypothetical protein
MPLSQMKTLSLIIKKNEDRKLKRKRASVFMSLPEARAL